MKREKNIPKHHNHKNGFDAVLEQASAADEKYGLTITAFETVDAFQQVALQTDVSRPSSGRKNPPWIYAAAALLLIGVVGIGYLVTPNRISVPNGKMETVTLPDHTTVTLNSGSELIYARGFNLWERTVTLKGEAFFDVTASDLPFKVKAGRALITVTGTKFNVRTWPTDTLSQTSVFLKEGRVLFSAIGHTSEPVALKAGQASRLPPGDNIPTPPQAAEQSKPIVWMHEGIAFENEPLAVVFDEISRRFDVQINTESESILKDSLTIYLSKVTSAGQALNDISKARGLSYRQDGDTFTVSRSVY